MVAYQVNKYPTKKIRKLRLKILYRMIFSDGLSNFLNAKGMALPTAKRKDGNTKSVNVQPFHSACSNCENGVAPLPCVFTIIMRKIVIPRNTSSVMKRCDCCFKIFCNAH